MIYSLKEYKKPLDTKSQNVVRSTGGQMTEEQIRQQGYEDAETAFYSKIEKQKEYRRRLASEILCATLRVPENRDVDFDTLSDFAVRQADSLIKKLNEPEI